jgi:nucleoside-diphosphate-sugar epimerase
VTTDDRHILVTGATGTVGRHRIDGLVRRGAAVRALIHDPRKRAEFESMGVQAVGASFEASRAWRSYKWRSGAVRARGWRSDTSGR